MGSTIPRPPLSGRVLRLHRRAHRRRLLGQGARRASGSSSPTAARPISPGPRSSWPERRAVAGAPGRRLHGRHGRVQPRRDLGESVLRPRPGHGGDVYLQLRQRGNVHRLRLPRGERRHGPRHRRLCLVRRPVSCGWKSAGGGWVFRVPSAARTEPQAKRSEYVRDEPFPDIFSFAPLYSQFFNSSPAARPYN